MTVRVWISCWTKWQQPSTCLCLPVRKWKLVKQVYSWEDFFLLDTILNFHRRLDYDHATFFWMLHFSHLELALGELSLCISMVGFFPLELSNIYCIVVCDQNKYLFLIHCPCKNWSMIHHFIHNFLWISILF